MKMKKSELVAINWYCETNNLRPELSIPPIINFTDKETLEKRSVPLLGIVTLYKAATEEDRKARAAERKLAKAAEAQANRGFKI